MAAIVADGVAVSATGVAVGVAVGAAVGAGVSVTVGEGVEVASGAAGAAQEQSRSNVNMIAIIMRNVRCRFINTLCLSDENWNCVS